jgi:hypothetical protein
MDISAITTINSTKERAILRWLYTYCQLDYLAINAELLKFLFHEETRPDDIIHRDVYTLKPNVKHQKLWKHLTHLKVVGSLTHEQLTQLVWVCPNLVHLESEDTISEGELTPHITHYTLNGKASLFMIENEYLTDLTLNATGDHGMLIRIECPALLRLTINDKRINQKINTTHIYDIFFPKLQYIVFGVNEQGNHPQRMLDLYEQHLSHIYLQPTPKRMNANREAALRKLIIVSHETANAKCELFKYSTPPQPIRRLV